MIETKDQEINDILKRAEDYRDELNKTNYEPIKFNFNSENDLGKIFEEFFKNTKNEIDINDKNNLFCKCKLSKSEALNGCEKTIKYKYVNKENKEIVTKQKVKFPKDIKDGQSIALLQNGNYIKELNKYGNLIITVNIK